MTTTVSAFDNLLKTLKTAPRIDASNKMVKAKRYCVKYSVEVYAEAFDEDAAVEEGWNQALESFERMAFVEKIAEVKAQKY